MSEVRAAVYLATKERLDRKRSSRGTIKCKAPNTACGSRCIPPAWDCRLKGEGSDPHLRAVKTDPLKGLAAIERGTKRIASGIAKGSFSDVEGGKASIIRGTVKIAPGDLQQKKRLQSELEDKTVAIGIGLAVVTGGLGVHALLMRSNQRYRFSVGNKIEEATREGVNKVLDALPYVGQQRAQTRNTVSNLVSTLAYRTRSEQLQGPLTLRGRLGQGGEAPLSGVSLQSYAESAGALSVQLKQLDDAFAQKPLGFATWNRAHRKRFWSVDEPLATDNRKPNIFARPAAESYLVKQYNLTNDESSTREAIQSALIGRATADKQALVRLAKQQGYRVRRSATGEVIDKDDVPTFVSRIAGNNFTSSTSAASIRRGTEQQLTNIINDSPSDNAKRIYKDTVDGFNQYFESVSLTISNIKRTGVISTQQRKLGYSEIATTADLARANYLASIMNHQHRIAGNAHAELVNLTYYSTRVAGPSDSTYYVSERLAHTAASEIAGRPVGTNEEAYRLLTTQYGFTGASKIKPKATKAKSTAPTPTPKAPDRKSKVTTSLNERIQDILARKGNENLSREAAQNIAKSEEKTDGIDKSPHHFHADSTALIRTATYIATRNDLQKTTAKGKPCGASHIPKSHECRKGQSATNTEASIQSETTKSNPKRILVTALGAVAAVGATAVAVDAARYFSNKHLPQTGDYRSVLKAQLKKDGLTVKDSQKAISNYYDEAAKDWRLGEVVYYKRSKEIDGHFGVYLGKRDGKHQFAGVGAATSEMGSKVPSANVGISEYGPNSKYDSKPVIWQKAPDKIQPPREIYSDTEIVKRATLMLGKPYKLDMLNNNCESWASMIVSGVPYSTQTKRFTTVTQGLIAARDKIVNRNAQGLTAEQMSTWLAFNHRRFVKDNEDTKYPTLVDPKAVLRSSMSELEAMLTVKQYLMTLLTPIK